MQYKNDSFLIDLEEEEGCRLVLDIKMSKEATKKVYKQATKNINKEISIPGFRKGKAPDTTVVKNFGTHIEKEWKELLINDAINGAFALTKRYPLNKNSFEKPQIKKCSLEEGAEILIAYEGYPQVPEIVFSELNLPEIQTKAISEEQVQEILKEIQVKHADFEDLDAEHKIEGSAHVELTIESLEEEPPRTLVSKRRFAMDDKYMPAWLHALLIGQSLGSYEGITQVDENATDEAKAGFVPLKIKVTIHSIKKIVLPEVNDALAIKEGGASLDELLQNIRTNLENQAKREHRSEQHQELQKVLLNHYTFQIPKSLLQKEKAVRLKEALKKHSEETPEVQERIAKEAEIALRLYFLHQQLVDQGSITVSTDEVNQEMFRYIYQNQLHTQKIDAEDIKKLSSRISSALLEHKTKEYLLSQVLLSHERAA